jgi:hypothetical protein
MEFTAARFRFGEAFKVVSWRRSDRLGRAWPGHPRIFAFFATAATRRGEKKFRSCFDASAGELQGDGSGVLKNLNFRHGCDSRKAKITPKNPQKIPKKSQAESQSSRAFGRTFYWKKRLTFTAKYGTINLSFVSPTAGGKSGRGDRRFWWNEANLIRNFNDVTWKQSQWKAKSDAVLALGKAHRAGI